MPALPEIIQLPKRISHQKFFPLILWDALGVLFSFLIALAFRFDGQIPANSWQFFKMTVPLFVLLYCGVNIFFSLYAHIWRYVSAHEINTIVGSTAISTALVGVFILFYDTVRPFPLSVVVLGGMFTTGLFTAVRYRQRLLTGAMGRLQKMVGSPDRKRILIVGAGEAGEILARQLRKHNQRHQYELIGFVDDDPQKLALLVHNAPILGARHAIPDLVTERDIHLIIIALHNISGHDLRDILSLCLVTEARVKMLPNFLGTMDSSQSTMLGRDITPADLLGREPYEVDETACRQLITGKVVLVTGAAGSIGSELCRQLLTFQPARLLMLDNNETGLYELMLTLQPNQSLCTETEGRFEGVTPLVADITNQGKVEQIFEAYRPQIIFHAAAYKHVPLMEQQPDEAVRVNILGTKIVSELAACYAAERFVFISSDKAINPSSIMGATKRIGEMLVTNSAPISNYYWLIPAMNTFEQMTNGIQQHYRQGFNGADEQLRGSSQSIELITPYALGPTLFTAVRFGNVLGSRGSVVPTFARQIELGGPITITHPEMTRYFISISEAISLVIQAATLTQGNDCFMLDMGQEIRIADLAHKMIRLRGLRPGEDIPIQYMGVRPGEKLHEELLIPGEERLPTNHDKIFRVRPTQTFDKKMFSPQLDQLIELARTQQINEMLELLRKLVQAETHLVKDRVSKSLEFGYEWRL